MDGMEIARKQSGDGQGRMRLSLAHSGTRGCWTSRGRILETVDDLSACNGELFAEDVGSP